MNTTTAEAPASLRLRFPGEPNPNPKLSAEWFREAARQDAVV
jgi:hypothetical protein